MSPSVALEPPPFPVDPFLPSHEDPYPLYRHLRDHCPVLLVPPEQHDRWIKPPLEPDRPELCVVSRYEDVEAILSDPATFRAGGEEDGGAIGLLGSDAPRHTHLRKAIRDAFAPKRVRQLQERVAAQADALVAALAGRVSADLAQELAWPLSSWVACELLGIPEADRERLPQWHMAVEYRGQPHLRRELVTYLAALVAERRAAPGEDLVSELLRAVPDGGLVEADVVELLRESFEGMVENPADLLGNALAALAAFPEQRAVLAAAAHEPVTLRAAIDELLRFDPPVQRNSRVATEDVELRGVRIPRGTEVMLLFGSVNRDERRFDEPDRLDLARPPQRSLAFGHGIHFCLGAPLTRVIATAALPRFVEAFPDYAPIGPVRRPPSQVMRAVIELPVTLG